MPAQKEAGVTKRLGGAKDLKSFVMSPEGSRFTAEWKQLEKQAALGRTYQTELKAEVLRLCLICDEGIYPTLSKAVEALEAEQLQELKKHYQAVSAEKFPVAPQLPGRQETIRFDGEAFRI